jgi:hypothetical protein
MLARLHNPAMGFVAKRQKYLNRYKSTSYESWSSPKGLMYTFVCRVVMSTWVFNANDWVEGQGEAEWACAW